LIITYKGFDFFIAGDLTDEVEPKLVEKGILKDKHIFYIKWHKHIKKGKYVKKRKKR